MQLFRARGGSGSEAKIIALEAEIARLREEGESREQAWAIHNAGQFELEAAKLVARYRRQGQPFALAMVEVWEASRPDEPLDASLQARIAGLLLETARLEDHVSFLAGGRFAVLLAEAHTEGSIAFIERVRFKLTTEPCEKTPDARYVRVVGGAAEWDERMESVEGLVAAACEGLDVYRSELARQSLHFEPGPA